MFCGESVSEGEYNATRFHPFISHNVAAAPSALPCCAPLLGANTSLLTVFDVSVLPTANAQPKGRKCVFLDFTSLPTVLNVSWAAEKVVSS